MTVCENSFNIPKSIRQEGQFIGISFMQCVSYLTDSGLPGEPLMVKTPNAPQSYQVSGSMLDEPVPMIPHKMEAERYLKH